MSVFLSMPGREVSTRNIVMHALGEGKRVFVPYIHRRRESGHQPTYTMDMLALESQEDLESLEPDNWGIPSLDADSVANRENALFGFGVQNDEGSELSDGSKIGGLDLVLVPGVAFDNKNRRLGHGKGYYDRYLQRYKDVVSWRKNAPMPLLGMAATSASMTQLLISSCLVGLALKEQILPDGAAIPCGPEDWTMDQVIDATGS